ncbi:hypothetical protein [Anabaena sp. CCY 9402-a]
MSVLLLGTNALPTNPVLKLGGLSTQHSALSTHHSQVVGVASHR